jgi:hypothetical protein
VNKEELWIQSRWIRDSRFKAHQRQVRIENILTIQTRITEVYKFIYFFGCREGAGGGGGFFSSFQARLSYPRMADKSIPVDGLLARETLILPLLLRCFQAYGLLQKTHSQCFVTVAPMRGIYLHLKQRYSAHNILH